MLLEFCRDVAFDHLGVFTYSEEEETEAFGAAGAVSAREKRRRRDKLMRQQAAISLSRNRELVGSRQLVLVEGRSSETDL